MKKALYLFLAMTLCNITTVSAEKMSFCQAFVKLGEQCDDFSAWKGSEISGSYGKFYSSLEVEGAMTSCIKEPMGDRSFVADFGTFDSESKAVEKVESLKKEMLTCYPFLKFADTKGTFSESISYIVHMDNLGMSRLSFRRPKRRLSAPRWLNPIPITNALRELPTKIISAKVSAGYWIKPKQVLLPSRVKNWTTVQCSTNTKLRSCLQAERIVTSKTGGCP